MIIVLEGPDGAGKSTLFHQLETALSEKVKFRMVPSRNPISQREFNDYLDGCIEDSHSPRLTIYDRVPWISDPIYSVVHQRPLRLNVRKLTEYYSLPQIVIFCNPSDISPTDIDRSYKAYKPRQDLGRVTKNHEHIVSTYRDFFNANRGQFSGYIHYDWTKDNVVELVNLLTKLLKVQDLCAECWQLLTNELGLNAGDAIKPKVWVSPEQQMELILEVKSG
jgi:hypothetical protein